MTVAELIEHLSNLPKDAKVIILDADTGWELNIPEDGINFHDGWVVLSSDYDHAINH